MATAVTLIRGDGIGPEVVDGAVQAITATGARIEWEPAAAGAGAIPTHGSPLPEATLDSIRKNRVCLKGPLATPIGGGYRSVNVALRQEFDLYANVRPARIFAGLPGRYDKVDLVVVRENTQGEYSGIEHFIDPTRSAAEAISIITRFGCDRIIRFAFEYARANGRRLVTLVHKANILKMTSGLFLQVGREIAQNYPDIKFTDIIVDNCAMQMVRDPSRFDVMVTTNLFGDILSDLAAGLVGGLGLVPGANIGEATSIFEAVHGTAPDIAGQGIANPTAAMLAGAMMLERLGQRDRGLRLEAAVRRVIAEGRDLTPDLGGKGTTQSFTDRVVGALAG
ncbi:MAG TPA: isocitrate/isopropylmalate dehydrogenase family protein [Polyangia bacterium]|jgi:isocitrate dehydrogenase (NAD+)|nr:isocitrate/isopropylmalate dehydrogenase family protein [Polyangia bacterium]